MKLRSLICVSAVATASAAFALDGGNTFARLRVDTGSITNSIIAIPFAGCGESAAEIYVTNLVMTTNLSAGDTLMYNNGTAWYAWEIQGGAWAPLAAGTKNGVTIAAPQDFKMLCGKACWLIRQSSSNPVYLYGQVTNVLRSVYVAGATGENAYGYTIIAKPSESSALDLNTWKGAGTGIGNGDTLLVPTASGTGQITYKYNGTAWTAATTTATQKKNPRTGEMTWVTNTTWTAISTSTTIPAGKGVMYGRKGAEGTTLEW